LRAKTLSARQDTIASLIEKERELNFNTWRFKLEAGDKSDYPYNLKLLSDKLVPSII
jgi:hypothetical protein